MRSPYRVFKLISVASIPMPKDTLALDEISKLWAQHRGCTVGFEVDGRYHIGVISKAHTRFVTHSVKALVPAKVKLGLEPISSLGKRIANASLANGRCDFVEVYEPSYVYLWEILRAS